MTTSRTQETRGWVSTRDPEGAGPVGFTEALFRGLAPDGGLYVPVALDPMDAPGTLRASEDFAELALAVAAHLLADDVPPLVLAAAVEEAFDFPVPVAGPLGSGLRVLELFHGPSLAFKDVGARFMAALMSRLDPAPDPARPRTVLVATSGDTGGAVAHAFHGREGFRVVVLFPRDGVSDVQRRLFTTLGGNVSALAVRGTFDDCQAMVKGAFAASTRGGAASELRLTSANSINVGRLLPQAFYYAEALRRLDAPGAVFSVPSGNLGNLTGGMLARRLGFPVLGLVGATNRNDAFRRWLEEGDDEPRPSVPTVSNAMDVARPSNLERIRWFAGDDREGLRGEVRAFSFDDEATLACMARVEREDGYLLDPHGAVAVLGGEGWLRENRSGRGRAAGGDAGAAPPVVALATAHPAKFPDVVRRAVGRAPESPPRLAQALEGEERAVEVAPTVEALLAAVGTVEGAGR